jgi:hypothetical protein
MPEPISMQQPGKCCTKNKKMIYDDPSENKAYSNKIKILT